MDQTELDLRQIYSIMRRRLRLLLILPATAGLVAALISFYVLAPVYQSSATIWVVKDGTSQLNYNDLLMNKSLTKTYAEVARSRAVVAEALKAAGVSDLTVADLQEKLTVTPVRDTEILSLNVEDTDPQRAAVLAMAIADAFKAQIKAYMKVENVSVVDPAAVPESPVKPRPLMNVAIALVLGAMAAVGLAFLLEYMDTTIRTQDDVERHLALPLMASIPVIQMETAAPAPAKRGKRASATGRVRNATGGVQK